VAPSIAFAAAFLTVVLFHALWDAANTMTVQLIVGAAGLALVSWRLQVATRWRPAP
jgi:hypothetical protein